MTTSSSLLRPLRLLGAFVLLSTALAACSTGNDEARTNVERSADKNFTEPARLHPSGGEDSARLMRDTMVSKQERQYQGARYRKDRNRDGIED